MKRRLAVPTYVWTFFVLVGGMLAGGQFPDTLQPVASFTAVLIEAIVTVVPLLILAALSPAIATLIRRGLAGRFAGGVVLWYVMSSTVAGLFGLIVSSLIFDVPFSTGTGGAWQEALGMFANLGAQAGASLPILAIFASVVLGILGVWIAAVGRVLDRVEAGIASAGRWIGYAMLPIVALLGVTIGVSFGARTGMQHYFTMTLYTAALCFAWWGFYLFVGVRRLGGRRPKEIITNYYLPTALFAAGTCSSLATLPVNLAAAKRVGVRNEVADFVIPFGSIFNLDASALAYVAYAPFVLGHIFGIPISWTLLLAAWPAIVLFTIAAPGLPAGMGTALWSATLFASMLGLEDPVRTEFLTTWIALSGGLPDMFRTATNCTGDGFTAIIFDRHFDRLTSRRARTGATAEPLAEMPALRDTNG